MRKILVFLCATFIFFSVVGVANALIVYEDIGIVEGLFFTNEVFVADVTPLDYTVTLTDLSIPPDFGFVDLALFLSGPTGVILTLPGPGSSTFTATLGETYFVDVVGQAGGNFNVGVYGVLVEAESTGVPEPATLLLLGTGLVGLVGLRRKFKA